MGCDYYIIKSLRIYFQNIPPLCIQIEQSRGDFFFSLDEDEADYEEKYDEYIKDALTPEMKPIIIYENNKFVNSRVENKYTSSIQEHIDIYNKSHETHVVFKDILDITKIETRVERF